jgi:exodeoxyribonuclease V alpha subunit
MATTLKELESQRDYANETTLRGKIAHLYFTSENFSAGVLAVQSGPPLARDCKFSVKAGVRIGEEIILHGKWGKHNKYGVQFVADTLEYPSPEPGVEGLANYLANNPAFRGIGPAKAKLIADTFGEEFDNTLRENPEKIAQLCKLNAEQMETLQREWVARADINAISQWLSSFGLTHCQIRRIAEKYGNRAKQVLTDNPYILCEEVETFGFARTDIVALKMGIPKDHPGRIRACLTDLVRQEAEEGGHTYVHRKELIKTAVYKLSFDTLAAEQLIRDQLAVMCSDDASSLVEVEQDGEVLIAQRWLYKMEMDIYQWLLQSRDNIPLFCNAGTGNLEPISDEALEYLFTVSMKDELSSASESQRQAIEMVHRSRISVISGGAGTGKSYTIARIYKIYRAINKTIGMCAPTGKAAKRMSQLAEGAEASTIHRLLNYNPIDGWYYCADNKLPHGLIIVDESSMCDIHLLWRLMSAIDFTKTQLLFVGDHNQLPPIGAGNVLRDILAHQIVPTHILIQCFRNAGQLKANCNSLLEGVLKPTTPVLPAGGREWRVVDQLEDTELVIESLRLLMRSEFRRWGFDPIEEAQIITPYNQGALGVNRINWELQKVWQYEEYNVELPEIDPEKFKGSREPSPRLYAHDKVMQIKNDYKLGPEGVMNGTTGVIQSVVTNDKNSIVYRVAFDGIDELVDIEAGSEQAKNLVLAYAVTIHKVQGSEYPCVVAVIHKHHTYMLSRNLVYTAATRARKTAILVGDRIGMRRAVNQVDSSKRRTWIGLLGEGN